MDDNEPAPANDLPVPLHVSIVTLNPHPHSPTSTRHLSTHSRTTRKRTCRRPTCVTKDSASYITTRVLNTFLQFVTPTSTMSKHCSQPLVQQLRQQPAVHPRWHIPLHNDFRRNVERQRRPMLSVQRHDRWSGCSREDFRIRRDRRANEVLCAYTVLPNSEVWLYQRRYSFHTKMTWVLDSWGELCNVGSQGGYHIQEGTCVCQIYTQDFVTTEEQISG